MAIELLVDADGDRPVVVKRTTEPAEAGRLRAEAVRLRQAAHPGVVALVAETDLDGGGVELRLAHAGRPLSLAGRLPVERAAAVATAVATTLADLHASGWVHGRITPSHVLLGERGRPRLGGVGPGGEGAEPADDVAALGELLVWMLEGGDEAEPIPHRRFPLRRRGGAPWARRALLTLADQAAAHDPAHRPTARRLAASLAEAVPSALLPADPTTDAPTATPAREQPTPADPTIDPPTAAPAREQPTPVDRLRARAAAHTVRPAPPAHAAPAHAVPKGGRTSVRRSVPVALALGGLVLVGVGLGRLAGGTARPELGAPPSAAADGDAMAPGAAPSDGAEGVPPATDLAPASGAGPAPACPPGDAGPDVDGDGCPDAVRVEDTTVTVAGTSYEVGQDGDRIVLGDWDCDGQTTVALLRPGTGEVFVFTDWATDGEELVAEPIDAVPGAVDVLVDDLGGGCHGLAAVDAEGRRSDVDGAGA